MYRQLLPVVLYLGSLTAAPQDVTINDSDITFIRPLNAPPADTIDNITTTAHDTTSRESRIENLPLPVPTGDAEDEDARVSTTTEGEDIVETTVEPVTQTPEVTREVQVKRTRPPFNPRFLSKLGYFKKDSVAPSTNLIERPGKRKFRSNCRCEKIWNCPKLQISVPRCPNEYFMCCL